MVLQNAVPPYWNDRTKASSDYCQMAQQTAVNNALGTLLGYLGSEIATPDIFDRLLWPSRFYSGFDIFKVPKMALFMPMGGPLHKASLLALDKILSNGLLRGRNQGHMLDSPFYHDTRAKYTVYDCVDGRVCGTELVRNGFWTRVIANLQITSDSLQYERYGPKDTPVVKPRAIHQVSHLKLSVPLHKPPLSEAIIGVVEATSFKTYLALVITEATGITVACAVMAIWRSWFMILYLVPLILKLTSAALTLDRHPLEIPKPSRQSRSEKLSAPTETKEPLPLLSSRKQRFDIHDLPHGILILEGDDTVVTQFFRHYGHPIRNRSREYAQILIVMLFGLAFPIGLLCSLLWMSVPLQYTWMGYQLYALCAMHIYRYAGGGTWATTEERVARKFASKARAREPQKIFLGSEKGVLMAELEVSYFSRYRDGRSFADELIYENTRWARSAEISKSSQDSSKESLNSEGRPRSLTPNSSGIEDV